MGQAVGKFRLALDIHHEHSRGHTGTVLAIFFIPDFVLTIIGLEALKTGMLMCSVFMASMMDLPLGLISRASVCLMCKEA